MDPEEATSRVPAAAGSPEAQVFVVAWASSSPSRVKRALALVLAAASLALVLAFGRAAYLPLILVWGVASVYGPTLLQSLVTVGADGIHLSRIGDRRFVPFADVRDSTTGPKGRGQGVFVALRSGETLSIGPTDEDKAARMLAQIQQRLKRHRGGDVQAAGALRRAGRASREWIASLRTLGSGKDADFRTARMPKDQLVGIVEDASADAEDRAAAAVALSDQLDDETRARVRAAASSTAAPGLRIAIEAAAEGADDEELGQALDTVETARR